MSAESPPSLPGAIFPEDEQLDWLGITLAQLVSEQGENIDAWDLDIKDEIFSSAAIQEAEDFPLTEDPHTPASVEHFAQLSETAGDLQAEPRAAVQVIPTGDVVKPSHVREVPTEARPETGGKNLDVLFQAASDLGFSQQSLLGFASELNPGVRP